MGRKGLLVQDGDMIDGEHSDEFPCPYSKDGYGHCTCWYDNYVCCWCNDPPCKCRDWLDIENQIEISN